MDAETREQLGALVEDVREKFERIEQDVPNQSFLVGGAYRKT